MNGMNHKLELLAPAGNLDIFKSVIDAGADAVYFGGSSFGARAYATNFTMEEASAAIDYAHLFGRKAYLTVNTLLKNTEIERQLFSYLKSYYEAGIDAVIVQDMGVFSMLRAYFSNLLIHASTQMTVANVEGAKYLEKLGASRVVTSREMSIDEIAAIHANSSIEIETFVHGALCVCYSGQCLMSSFLGGRSGNRGRCAQPCRLPYKLYDEREKQLSLTGDYLLSPKDLCGIEDLSALASAGVMSFKIEGRMKQMEYATGVVSIYRKYLDAMEEGITRPVAEEDKNLLYRLGNRCGFTNRYFYEKNHKDMITYKEPSHKKEDVPTMTMPPSEIALSGVVTAKMGQPLSLTVYVLNENVHGDSIEGQELMQFASVGEVVAPAKNRPMREEELLSRIHKTGGTHFFFAKLTAEVDEGIFVPVGALNQLRRDALDGITQEILAHAKRKYDGIPFSSLEDQIADTGKKKDVIKEFSAIPSADFSEKVYDLFVTCETRVQWQEALRSSSVKRLGIALECLVSNEGQILSGAAVEERVKTYAKEARDAHKAFIIVYPIICRQTTLDLLGRYRILSDAEVVDGILAKNYDTLGFLDHVLFPREKTILDHRLYTYSNRAKESFLQLGYKRLCTPVELHKKELAHCENENSDFILYGRQILMVTANCQQKNAAHCTQQSTTHFLLDRKNVRFPVKNECAFCYNKIYNSKITSLFSEAETIKRLFFAGHRIDFSYESAEEAHQILSLYERGFYGRKMDDLDASKENTYTKGHFHRGVE